MHVVTKQETEAYLEFSDNHLLPPLFGEHDANLALMEKVLNVHIQARGNQVLIKGAPVSVAAAQEALEQIYHRLKAGTLIEKEDIQAAIRLALTPYMEEKETSDEGAELLDENSEEFVKAWPSLEIRTHKKTIAPRSAGQAKYLDTLRKNNLVFAVGPAGTGKTYLAAAMGVSMLLQGKVDRIIMSRPAVEAGERLGFLPGDMREKVDPYLRPLYDALYDMLPGEQVEKRIERGELEVAPLAFMRGRTLSSAYVILDEAQNTTSAQMKMFLTRMGSDSYMVITGDTTQIDLPSGEVSGLKEASRLLKNVKNIGFASLEKEDIVRHPLVTKIVEAYEKEHDKRVKSKTSV